MKVLIKDGSNPITWYHGLEGMMFPVAHIKDAHYFVPDEVVPDGGSFGPCGVHFPDGELLYTDAEYNEANQELLQKREEVKDLMQKNFSLDGTVYRKQRSIDLLMNKCRDKNVYIGELEKTLGSVVEERNLLLKQIERTLVEQQPKPSVLPREVAETLKSWQRFYSNKSLCHDVLHPRSSNVGLDVVSKFANEHFDVFLAALVNSYTVEVEETPEERLLNYFNLLTPKGWKFSGDASDPVYIARDSIRTTCSILGRTIDGINEPF